MTSLHLSNTLEGHRPKIYKYEAILSGNMIRVLKLIQHTGSSLECSIRQINIADSGYQALSYEWGASEQPYTVQVRDAKGEDLGLIPLTTNLHHALRDLRDSLDIKSKEFWIDQICIDQNNEEEKGYQVALMADVYRNALQVITYLGPQFHRLEDENGALGLISQIYEHVQPYLLEMARTIPSLARTNSKLVPLLNHLQGIDQNNPHWTNLLRIVYSGWTNRIWMVQENVLCPNTVMLRGTRVLDWISVATIPVLFSMNVFEPAFLEKQWPILGFKFHPDPINDAVKNPWRWRLETAYTGRGTLYKGKLNLASHLVGFGSLGCQDPRDRVYAVLGMSVDAKELGIIPNYQESASHIFKEVSMRIYHHYQNLKFLSNMSGYDNFSDTSVPTWAYHNSPIIETFIPSYSKPHQSTHGDIRFESSNSIMIVKGRIVDKIKIAQPLCPFLQITIVGKAIFARNETSRQLLRSSATVLDYMGMSLKSVSSLFYSWTCGDCLPTDRNDVDIAFTVWCKFMNTAYCLVRDDPEFLNEPWFYERFIPTWKSLCDLLKCHDREAHSDPQVEIEDEHRQIARQVDGRLYCRGRSFCITEGMKVCNVSGKVQEGDVIGVLATGDHAYLLRPDGDKYRYVGTAYVDGIMHGELCPGKIDSDIRLI
jgi:heterokaryon incompatibility protein (HET)